MTTPKKKSVRVVSKDGKQFFVTEMPGPFFRISAEDFLGDFCDWITIEVYRNGKKIAEGGIGSFLNAQHFFFGLKQFMNLDDLDALYADKFQPSDILLIPREAGYKW